MKEPSNQGKTQSALRRVGQSIVRFLRRINAPAFPGSPPAWTNGMSMAVVLIFFLILLLHPSDEFLSRTLSSYEPLNGARHLTDIGLSQWYLIPAFVIGVCLIGIDWGNIARHRRIRFGLVYAQATFAFWAIALSGILTNIAKFLIGRARPKFIDTLGANSFSPLEAGYNFASFPSGHSTTMGAVGAILALWFPHWRMPIILATMFIAFTRVFARAHYPTDVVAGYTVGFLFAVVLARFLAGRRTAFVFGKSQFWPNMRFRERFWQPEADLSKK